MNIARNQSIKEILPMVSGMEHTCASRLGNKGVDLYVVKEYLGHGSIEATERYAAMAPDKLSYAATILDDLNR